MEDTTLRIHTINTANINHSISLSIVPTEQNDGLQFYILTENCRRLYANCLKKY